MRHLVLLAVAVVGPLPLAGCSSSTGIGQPTDLSPAVKTQWDAYCAAREACLSGVMCATSACMAQVAEEGPLVEFLDCQNAKACGANDDDCFASAGTTDAEREAFIPRCEAALAAIPPSPPSCYVDPVLCTIVAQPVIRKQHMHAVDACLTAASACADLQTCMDTALRPLNCS